MERVAGDQVLRRREQHGVALRHVGGQVENAAGEHQLGKVRVPADVRVGAGEAEEPYARRRRQLLDGGRLGGGDQERGVDLPALELLDGSFTLERQQLGAGLVRSRRAEHGGGEIAGAALRSPDRDPASLQGPDVVNGVAPIEYPERDIGDASERLDPRSPFAGVGAALHEGDVHAAVGVGEELDIGEGSACLPHLQRDSVALEDLLVPARVVSGATFIGRNCRGEPFGRRRLDEEHGDAERRRDDQDRRSDRDPEIRSEDAPGPWGKPVRKHGGGVYAARPMPPSPAPRTVGCALAAFMLQGLQAPGSLPQRAGLPPTDPGRWPRKTPSR